MSKIRWGAFVPVATLLIATTLVGIFRPDVFYHAQEGLAKATFTNLGWLFNLVTFSVMFICFYLGLSARYGSIIIGGKDATPTIGEGKGSEPR